MELTDNQPASLHIGGRRTLPQHRGSVIDGPSSRTHSRSDYLWMAEVVAGQLVRPPSYRGRSRSTTTAEGRP